MIEWGWRKRRRSFLFLSIELGRAGCGGKRWNGCSHPWAVRRTEAAASCMLKQTSGRGVVSDARVRVLRKGWMRLCDPHDPILSRAAPAGPVAQHALQITFCCIARKKSGRTPITGPGSRCFPRDILKNSDDDDDTGRDATTGAAAESVCPKEPHRCRRRERRKKANQSYPVTRTCPVLRCTACGGATRRPEISCLYFASIRLPPFLFCKGALYVTRYDSRMSRAGRTLREMEEVWMNARRRSQLTERLRIVMHGLARLYACGVGPGPEGEIIDRQGVSIDARLLQMW